MAIRMLIPFQVVAEHDDKEIRTARGAVSSGS
jgi:hypothetical protein